jgi:hypothetical protein
METKLDPEKKAPLPLTAESRSPTKSKDQLDVHFEPEWSALRSGKAGRPIHCYTVRNLTKDNQYTVEFFEDDNGRPMAHCNCPALVVDKHIKAALEDLLQREPGFGKLNQPEEETVNDNTSNP